MDKNQGYEIIKAVMLENGRGFALGHNPAAPSPYVTWAYYDDKDGKRQYEWGHYGNDRAALEQDFTARVKRVPASLQCRCQAGRGSRPLQVLLYPAPCGHWDIPEAAPQRPG